MKNNLIDTNKKEFIDEFYASHSTYLKYKKDYFYVKLLHQHFCQKNMDIKDELKIAKFKSILNTHRSQRNSEFNLKKYQKCEFFWKNLNLYILSDLGFISETLNKTKNTNYENDLNKIVVEHINNFEKITKDLEIQNSKVSSNKISDIIKHFKNFIRVIKGKES